MSAKDHPAAHFEVNDPAAAFRKFEDAARKLLAVPKKGFGAKPAAGGTKKKRKDR